MATEHTRAQSHPTGEFSTAGVRPHVTPTSGERMTTAPGASAITSPRIAVTWAASAPSHEDWFHAELDALTHSAVAAVERAGGTAVVLDAADPNLAGTLLDGHTEWDGLLVMGGGDVDPVLYDGDPDHPAVDGVDANADAFEASAVVQALATGRPVLGICRGLQIINVALGGSLREDLGIPVSDGALPHRNHTDPAGPMIVHDVAIHRGSRLADALGTQARVVSGHHQAAKRIAEALRVTATAPDGVVEALEATDPREWLVAVQWHPEDPQTEPGQLEAILDAFLAACAARTASTGSRATQQTEEAPR